MMGRVEKKVKILLELTQEELNTLYIAHLLVSKEELLEQASKMGLIVAVTGDEDDHMNQVLADLSYPKYFH